MKTRPPTVIDPSVRSSAVPRDGVGWTPFVAALSFVPLFGAIGLRSDTPPPSEPARRPNARVVI